MAYTPLHTEAVKERKRARRDYSSLLAAILGARQINNAEKFEIAIQDFEAYAEKSGSMKLLGDVHLHRGKFHEVNNRFSASLAEFKKALFYYESSPETIELPEILMLIGCSYSQLGLYQQAIEYHQRCYGLAIAQGGKVVVTAAISMSDIAMILSQMQQYDRALEYLYTALNLIEQTDEPRHLSYVHSNLGTIYTAIAHYEKALEHYSISLGIKESIGHTRGVALVLTQIGSVYSKLGHYEKALEFLHRSLLIKESMGDRVFQVTTLSFIADVYRAIGKTGESLAFALRSLDIALTSDNSGACSAAHLQLSRCYSDIGNFEKAYEHHVEYHKCHDEHIGKNTQQRFQELAVAFDIERVRSEKDIERLRAENLQQEIEHKNKELVTLALSLTQKNEMLTKLQEHLKTFSKPETTGTNELQSLRTEISSLLSGEKAWQTFEQMFHSIHLDFMQRLSHHFPHLTPTELRLCALLKINLSTKEIASILCISPKSAEMYRFRLRRKLDIGSTVNLSLWLARF